VKERRGKERADVCVRPRGKEKKMMLSGGRRKEKRKKEGA
jgi:hypothetical protein